MASKKKVTGPPVLKRSLASSQLYCGLDKLADDLKRRHDTTIKILLIIAGCYN